MNEVYKLWIIHSEIGMCILEQTFKELPQEIDSDLVSGFLNAMRSFSMEIANESVERIQLESIAIQYYTSEKYLIAACVDRDYSQVVLGRKLEKASQQFEEKYGKILENFSGNVELFQDFGKDLEMIMEQSAISLKYIDKTTDQIEEYLNQRKSEFDELRNTIESLIMKKGKEMKDQLQGKITLITSKIRKKLNL